MPAASPEPPDRSLAYDTLREVGFPSREARRFEAILEQDWTLLPLIASVSPQVSEEHATWLAQHLADAPDSSTRCILSELAPSRDSSALLRKKADYFLSHDGIWQCELFKSVETRHFLHDKRIALLERAGWDGRLVAIANALEDRNHTDSARLSAAEGLLRTVDQWSMIVSCPYLSDETEREAGTLALAAATTGPDEALSLLEQIFSNEFMKTAKAGDAHTFDCPLPLLLPRLERVMGPDIGPTLSTLAGVPEERRLLATESILDVAPLSNEEAGALTRLDWSQLNDQSATVLVAALRNPDPRVFDLALRLHDRLRKAYPTNVADSSLCATAQLNLSELLKYLSPPDLEEATLILQDRDASELELLATCAQNRSCGRRFVAHSRALLQLHREYPSRRFPNVNLHELAAVQQFDQALLQTARDWLVATKATQGSSNDEQLSVTKLALYIGDFGGSTDETLRCTRKGRTLAHCLRYLLSARQAFARENLTPPPTEMASPVKELNLQYARELLGIDAVENLRNQFGLVYFTRYPAEVLQRMAEGDSAQPELPVLLVIQPHADWNGAFVRVEQLDELAQHYNVVAIETGDANEVSLALERFRPAVILLGGHGSSSSIQLGDSGPNPEIDIHDVLRWPRLDEAPETVILESCSTAKGRTPIAQVISARLGSKVYGPKKDAALVEIAISQDSGAIDAVQYTEPSALFEAGELIEEFLVPQAAQQ